VQFKYKASNNSLKALKYLGLFLVLGLLAYYIYQFDISLVINSLSNFLAVYGLVLLLSFIAYFFATWAWRYCFENKTINLIHLFEVRLIGEMLSLINPTSVLAGDGFKCYLLVNHGLLKKDVVNSVLISRMLTVLSFVFLAIVSAFGLLILGGSKQVVFLAVISISLFLVLGLLCYVIFSPKLFLYKIFRFSGLDGVKYINRKHWSRTFKAINLSSAQFFRHSKSSLFKSFIFYILHWLLGALEVYVILYFLDINVVFFDALFIECGVVLMKSILAFIPGQIGVEELTNKVILGMLGASNPVAWLILSIVRRARFIFWLAFALGIYYAKHLSISKKKLARGQIL